MKHLWLKAGLVSLIAALVISGIHPYERGTWWMEVAPVLIALPLLIATYKRFPLTPLLYTLIWLQALVLILGGAYTYARVPLGFAIQDWLGMDRNPYDKIGHFMQGLTPAIVARELLVRHRVVLKKGWLFLLCLCVVMFISSLYELIEWGAALMLGQGAEEFLGTQGYQWDTQSDMFYALIGGLVALTVLAPLHDRQMISASSRPIQSTSNLHQ